jgi:uncharacterized protein (TIGR02391 family)
MPNSFSSMKSLINGRPTNFPKMSQFCGECGTPYPWTVAKHDQIDDAGFWKLLHPKVSKLARPRFESGHYADAVEASLKELNTDVKSIYRKAKNVELDGVDLMRKAFRGDDPVIRLEDLSTESGKNIQDGYSHIMAGVLQAIRNPKAHENIEISADRAIHLLTLASLLFYRLDERKMNRNDA